MANKSAGKNMEIVNRFSGEKVKLPAEGRIVKMSAHSPFSDRNGERPVIELSGIVLRYAEACDKLVVSFLTLEGKTETVYADHVVKATSIRSLPQEARDVLKRLRKWYVSEVPAWKKKERELAAKKAAAKKAAGADDPKAAIARSMNGISDSEFRSELEEHLGRAFGGTWQRGGWHVSYWGGVAMASRSADIQKYYSGSLAYMEYDNTMALYRDCEESDEGRRYIARFAASLPVKASRRDRFELGDKDWLLLYSEYEIGKVDGVPTAAKARELAEGFCGKKL